jgi:hypothetical protein
MRRDDVMDNNISNRPWVFIIGLSIILIGIYLLLAPMYFLFALLVLIVWQGVATRKYMLYLACLLVPSLVYQTIEVSRNYSTAGMDLIMIACIIIAWQALGVNLIPRRSILKYFFANVVGIMILTLVFTGGELFRMAPAEWIRHYDWILTPALTLPGIGIGIGWMGRDMMNAKPIEKWPGNGLPESRTINDSNENK